MKSSLKTALRMERGGYASPLGIIAPGVPVRRYGLIALGAAIAVGVELKYGGFLTVGNLVTTLNNVSTLGIASVGAAALLIAGRIDLSIGGQLSLLAIMTALVGEHISSGPLATLACIGVALGGGLVLGLANAVLIRFLRISPLIVTIATGGIFTGIALAATGGFDVSGAPSGIVALGTNHLLGIPVPIVIAAGVFLIGAFVLLCTVSGLRIYAIGGNGTGAALTGVPVDRIVTGLYCSQGLLVGIVALIEVGQVGAASATFGTSFEIYVLTAVLLGGVLFSGGAGRPIALLLGVLTIGVLNSALVFIGVANWWNQIISGSVLLLALGMDEFAVYRRAKALTQSNIEDPAEAESTGPRHDQPSDANSRVANDWLAAQAQQPRPATRGASPVLSVQSVKLRYGAVQALHGVDLNLVPGEVTCLVGDNGGWQILTRQDHLGG